MNRPTIQVHLVAPTLVCWGLQRLIQAAGAPLVLTGWSATLEDALPQLEREMPDVVVLDFDDNYTVQDVERLYTSMRTKILVITSHLEDGFPASIVEAGARGVLQKREAPAALLKAIEAVGGGQIFASAQTTQRMFVTAVRALPPQQDAEPARAATLTWRERQTVAAVTSDAAAPVKVIASRLCVSEHTLRNHLTSIYSKLGVSGRLGLYAYASEHGLARATQEKKNTRERPLS
jgi:two-component system, NarL family, nitrate/nitrite response regulator NarL